MRFSLELLGVIEEMELSEDIFFQDSHIQQIKSPQAN